MNKKKQITSAREFLEFTVNNDLIKKISFSDKKIKELFLRQKPYKAFEDSWYALIQGIRRDPCVYDQSIFFSSHPRSDNYIVIYNHCCKSLKEFSEKVSNLAKLCNKRVIWKNVPSQSVDELFFLGFRPYKTSEFWSIEAPFDDQTYPQYVCNINRLLEKNSKGKLAQLKQQFRSVEKNIDKIYIHQYSKDQHKISLDRLLKDVSREIVSKNSQDIQDVYDSNRLFLDHPPDFSYVLSINHNPISFIGLDIREETANFNCLIYDRSIKYLATYTILSVCKLLKDKGALYLNLSGSEIPALDYWKKKFFPERKFYRTHLIKDCF